MVSLRRVAYSFGTFIFSVYIWQLIARKEHWEVSPARLIERCATIAEHTYNWIGIKVAWISSFYTLIDFSEVLEALKDLARPSLKLALSFFHIFNGYYETAETYKYPILIGAGTLTLISLCVWLLHHFEYINAKPFLIFLSDNPTNTPSDENADIPPDENLTKSVETSRRR